MLENKSYNHFLCAKEINPWVKLFVLEAMVLCILAFPAWATSPQNTGANQITLEAVDINGDGSVSSEEAKIFIQKLIDEDNKALEQQKKLSATSDIGTATLVISFAEADVNKDGIVSLEENAAHQKMLKLITAAAPVPKGDVKKKEMVHDKAAPSFLKKTYDRRLKEMGALDANNDGILQAEELAQKSARTFGAADTNQDGILSPDEMAMSQQKIRQQSFENDNSRDAASRQAMKAKVHYKNADKDDDNKVSKEEYDAYFGDRYQNFDQNKDGIVSEKEYRTDGEKLPSSYLRKPKDD